MRIQFVIILFFLCEPHALAGNDPLADLKKGQPKDFIELIDRLVGCNHWRTELPYDAARRREISTAMADLKCKGLEKDEAALRVRYAQKPGAIKLLKQAKESSY